MTRVIGYTGAIVLLLVAAACGRAEPHYDPAAHEAEIMEWRAGRLERLLKPTGYLAQVGPALYEEFIARGVLLRPLGNTVYVMPPYCITSDQLDFLYAALANGGDPLTFLSDEQSAQLEAVRRAR